MSDQIWNRGGLPRHSVELRDGVWVVVPGGCNTFEEAAALADARNNIKVPHSCLDPLCFQCNPEDPEVTA